jgi:hypothetical protein
MSTFWESAFVEQASDELSLRTDFFESANGEMYLLESRTFISRDMFYKSVKVMCQKSKSKSNPSFCNIFQKGTKNPHHFITYTPRQLR